MMATGRQILNLRFNQDQTCFACCMESGLRIYNIEPLAEHVHLDAKTVGSVSQCEMLHHTNVLAIVAGGLKPHRDSNIVRLFDHSEREFFCELKFSQCIKAVRLHRNTIVVALQKNIYVYSFPEPIQQLFMIETGNNVRGLCELSSFTTEDKLLVFPGHRTGYVQFVDLSKVTKEKNTSLGPVTIKAHDNELVCLSLNQRGDLLATASTRGTLIRVWNTHSKAQMFELRRGSDPATIYCINFSRDSDFLSCSSDKGTVHIFALQDIHLNRRHSLSTLGFLGKYGDSQWGFTNFTVPPECACICAFGPKNTIIALCIDGSIRKYVFTDGKCSQQSYDDFLKVCDDEEYLS